MCAYVGAFRKRRVLRGYSVVLQCTLRAFLAHWTPGVRYGTLEYASNHLGSSSSCMSLNWSISLCRFIACSHLDRATCPAPPDEAMCRWNVPPHHRW